MMLAKFRQKYPQGSLIGELIDIDRGTYIVRVSAIAENITLATGLASGERVETAEDKARERAIAALCLDSNLESSTVNLTSSFTTGDRSIKTAVSNPLPNSQSRVTTSNRSVTPSVAPQPQVSSEGNFIKNNEEIPVALADDSSQIASPSADNSSVRETIVSQTNIELEPEVKPVERSSEPTVESNLFEGTYNTATVSPDLPSTKNNLNNTGNSHATEVSPSQEMAVVIEDIHEIIHQTDIEVKRLGWTKNDGKEFLKSRYGKYSRISLTDEQLLEFLEYLKSQPTPT